MELITCIVVLVMSIICGIICVRTINKFGEGKINQNSWQYQICGYLFANIAVFGFIFGFGRTLGIILEYLIGI